MANEHLATYLNDHLAGSAVALELLDQLEATHSDGTLGDFFSSYAPMLPQIATTSKGLMQRLHIGDSRRINAGSEIVFSKSGA